MGGFCGYGGSVWVMGEWAMGYWIVGVTSFQKKYGLYSVSRFPCCISFIFVALIFVLKYSRRWRPPIGGCKKFEPPFRPEMSNLVHFFCIIALPHTFCPTKTRFHPLWSTPEPPGASSLGPGGCCSSLQTSCLK